MRVGRSSDAALSDENSVESDQSSAEKNDGKDDFRASDTDEDDQPIASLQYRMAGGAVTRTTKPAEMDEAAKRAYKTPAPERTSQ